MPPTRSISTQISIPENITGVVWDDNNRRYKQYTTVKCGCTTSMDTECRRWAIGFRDGTIPVCMAHFTPTQVLSPEAIARRRENNNNRRTLTVNERIASISETITYLQRIITPEMTTEQTRAVFSRIGLLSRDIERIRAETGTVFTTVIPAYKLDDINEEVPPEEQLMVEDECPICMEDYMVTRTATCGHHACSTCCRHMKESGRTLNCPLCRDNRFRSLVDYMVRST